MLTARLFFAVALTLKSAPLVVGQPATPGALSGPLLAHVRGERFGVVTSLRGLPLGVRDSLQGLFGGPALSIAEPGAPYQATDDIADPTLPGRRMVAAGCSVDHCLVYYERGGYAHVWHVALFHWTPDATRLEWGGVAPGGLSSIDEVKAAVLSGAIRGPVKAW